eukprot:gene32677-42319_t
MIIIFKKHTIYVAFVFLSVSSGLYRKVHRSQKPFTSIFSTPIVTHASEKDSFSLLFDDSLKEVETPIALKLIGGPLPSYLSGILIKNGPASFGEVEIKQGGSSSMPRRRYSHIFDGLAKLTKYEFTKEGSISFTSKFLHSSIYNRVVKEKG